MKGADCEGSTGTSPFDFLEIKAGLTVEDTRIVVREAEVPIDNLEFVIIYAKIGGNWEN